MGDRDDAVPQEWQLLLLCKQQQAEALAAHLTALEQAAIANVEAGNSSPAAAAVAAQLAAADPAGFTPLLVAARMGWAHVVRRLLALGALPGAQLASSGNSALHLAAMHGHLEVLRLLLAVGGEGSEVGVHNTNGDSPLHFAASAGHVGAAACLIKAGAQPGAANVAGLTPLLAAAGSGHALALQLLLKQPGHEALLAARDKNGSGPLHFACSAGHAACVRLLLDGGCRGVHERNNAGQTPLQLARKSGDADCIRLVQEVHEAMDRAAREAQAEAEAAEGAAASSTRARGPSKPKQAGAATTRAASTAKGVQRTHQAAGCAAAGSPEAAVLTGEAQLEAAALAAAEAAGAKSVPAASKAAAAPPAVASTAAVQPAGGSGGLAAAEQAEGGPVGEQAEWVVVQGRHSSTHGTSKQGQQTHAGKRLQPAASASQPPPAVARGTSSSSGAAQQRQRGGTGGAAPPGMRAQAAQVAQAPSWSSRLFTPQPTAPAQGSGAGSDTSAPLLPAAQPPAPPTAAAASALPAPPAAAAALPAAAAAAAHPATTAAATPPAATLAATADWVEAAEALLVEAHPAGAALDVRPCHVLGLGLEGLSVSQLEALEAIHRHALAAVAEARMQLAQRQFSEAAASEAERKAHIRALACQLQAGGQPAAAVAAQGGGSA